MLKVPRKLRYLWYIQWNRFVLKRLIGQRNLGPRAMMYSKVYFDICPGAKV